MKKIQVFITLFISLLIFSCQVDPNGIINEKYSNKNARQLTEPEAYPGFYSITYGSHGSMTIGNYIKKARINFPNHNSNFLNVLISNMTSYRNGLGSIQRGEFDALVSDLGSTSYYPKWFTFTDGQKYVIYRNWTYSSSKPKPFIIRNPQDMQFAATSPFYYLSGFISCNLDPNFGISFGIPQKIKTMPSTLKFTQEWNSGNPGHIGIKPVSSSINQSNLQAELDLITVEAAQ